MAIPEQTSKAFLANDRPVARFGVGGVLREQEQVVLPLARTLKVVVVDVLGDSPLEGNLTEEDHRAVALRRFCDRKDKDEDLKTVARCLLARRAGDEQHNMGNRVTWAEWTGPVCLSVFVSPFLDGRRMDYR